MCSICFPEAHEYRGLTDELCLVYLGDNVVFGRTFTEYLQRLQTVFDRLCMAQTKLKPSKDEEKPLLCGIGLDQYYFTKSGFSLACVRTTKSSSRSSQTMQFSDTL